MSRQLTITIADWVYNKIEQMRKGQNRSEFVEKLVIHSPEFEKNEANKDEHKTINNQTK